MAFKRRIIQECSEVVFTSKDRFLILTGLARLTISYINLQPYHLLDCVDWCLLDFCPPQLTGQYDEYSDTGLCTQRNTQRVKLISYTHTHVPS